MNKKIIYACAAILSLTVYSCSVDPLEKESKPLNTSDSFKGGEFSTVRDSIQTRSFGQEMESAENLDKIIDKGKK
ncbi:hypothetical protein [Myroides odoratimimus]|uniref:hypothetical protein n=1 Tax=Myroides odoratimimus TaxID=76832 RepID=UPI000469E1AB|nr:hypothetical protein [Myroides odoratimimus]